MSSKPVGFIVIPLRFTPNIGSVIFQPKCNPMGSQRSRLRRKASPKRMPKAMVLAIPSLEACGLVAWRSPKITPVGRMVVNVPKRFIRTWKPKPWKSNSSPMEPQSSRMGKNISIRQLDSEPVARDICAKPAARATPRTRSAAPMPPARPMMPLRAESRFQGSPTSVKGPASKIAIARELEKTAATRPPTVSPTRYPPNQVKRGVAK